MVIYGDDGDEGENGKGGEKGGYGRFWSCFLCLRPKQSAGIARGFLILSMAFQFNCFPRTLRSSCLDSLHFQPRDY